ncbi:hypothetical protein EN866_32840 [Mesorhizobium sp. M2D.F.Ca.ET.223.01.1.1]|uniref:hypothetical protein n=1 Tax=Mesorhizobium sp. M2D.F.Ca.ET.223.01.1.1 TaxID=2563940 RepID=UPI0010931C24|nr:hypothetical protein [Mesorhizobium sp. M2D.F.Ca.ET.223.01.1.1]TGR84595.1 hypothetical protein EN866_32840 [Mesorhizobium sp. M2D.F.Ca.ET.223.01.1.1]TGT64291.1 hypothetical protein EN802_32905 [bacterium M00.F.Ca.ET.159.01.1.1]TGT79227.1 hypothetical protein EN800_32250 [bacterium M00.F.Ca.ET.157.01.1.1]
MTLLASVWLLLSVVMCSFAWIAGKRLAALSLPLAVALAALAIYVPTGLPRFTQPPAGKYTVLGADIQVDIAIFVLLKSGDMPPTYYKLPYTAGQANALQEAKDSAGENGQVTATIGEDGGTSYDGPPPVQGEPPKQAEQPAVQIP